MMRSPRRIGAALAAILLFVGVTVTVWFWQSSPASLSENGGRGVNGRLPNQPVITEQIISEPVTPVVRPAITSLPLANPEMTLDREINARLTNHEQIELALKGVPGLDPLVARQAVVQTAVSAFLTPTLNISGQAYSFVNPPDTVGDVGPHHYIQMINSGSGAMLTIYNKQGAELAGPVFLDSFGTGACAAGRGDPIVLYDQLADRWLLSEFASTGFHLCVYISETNDPVTTSWYAYDFPTPNFPDYPKYGVWPDAYYVSSNESSPAVYALDRAEMLQGNPATYQRFTAVDLNGFGFQALIPSDHDGFAPPPTGAPNYFLRHRDDEVHNGGQNNPDEDYLEIWEFQANFDDPSSSSFAKTQDIPITEIDSDLCGLFSFSCFPQPNSTVRLDPLREVVMWRLQYQNFGTHETLAANLVTDVDGSDHGGVRWFELRKSGLEAWSLYQEGTLAPDAYDRWLGSAALDGVGNLAVGYSVVGDDLYPSIRYAGRLVDDPLGTLPYLEGSLGEGSAANGSNRWGDYGALSLDPGDSCTFWYTNMFNTSNQWRTQIGTFQFPECVPNGFRLTAVPQAQSVCVPDTAVVDLHLVYEPTFNNNIDLTATDVPSGTTAVFAPSTIISPTNSSVLTMTVTSTPPGTYDVQVVGIGDPTPTNSTTIQLSTFNMAPDFVTLHSPSNNEADVNLRPTFSWNAATGTEQYQLEIAEDSGFTNVILATAVATNSYTLLNELAPFTTYFWRVTAVNACGDSTSTSYQFTTGEALFLKNYFPIIFNER